MGRLPPQEIDTCSSVTETDGINVILRLRQDILQQPSRGLLSNHEVWLEAQ